MNEKIEYKNNKSRGIDLLNGEDRNGKEIIG